MLSGIVPVALPLLQVAAQLDCRAQQTPAAAAELLLPVWLH
jgi:hypothetical protein